MAGSTVKITGRGLPADPGGERVHGHARVVVTNAHVVAGEEVPRVETYEGKRLEATVILFDPRRRPGRAAGPRPEPGAAARGEGQARVTRAPSTAIPAAADLRAAPAVISEKLIAVGRDIYDREETRRDIFVLGSDLRPGDSGGALIDKAGSVVGVAFAIAPDKPGTSYALTDKELRPVLTIAGAGGKAVGTGRCLDS